jgi:hypothetical protein
MAQLEMTRREKWAVRLGLPALVATAVMAVLIWPLFWFGLDDPYLQWMTILFWGLVLPVGIISTLLARGQFLRLAQQYIRNLRAGKD